MRKIILLTAVLSIYLLACNDDKKESYPTIPEKEVGDMAVKYKEIITKDLKYVIKQITMDPEVLRKLVKKSDRVKLISAGYLVPRGDTLTTVVIQLRTWKEGRPVYTYYDFRSIFKPVTTPSASAKTEEDDNTICPPPDDCGIPLIKQ